MKVKQVFALSALALAAGVALADEAPRAPLSRAEVEQASGQGELGPQFAQRAAAPSTVSRAAVKAGVLEARADHDLAHGQADESSTYAMSNAPQSTLSRAEVKAEVLEARADHELVLGQVEQPLIAGTYKVGHPFASVKNWFASIRN